MRFWLVIVGLVVCGCGAHERDCADQRDNDGDGWTDCADQDCAASCGEICGNLLDDDGNGKIDCEDPACDSVCASSPGTEDCTNGVDDDGDWLIDCGDDDCDAQCDADADGWVAVDHGGLDCDDHASAVHPEATEVPYNGADDDCDSATPDDDVDGDGFPLATDCDDTDGLTFPGAPETCGDGVINDCDREGTPSRADCYGERPAWTADATLLGASQDDLSGYNVSAAGDLDNDGYDDLVVGAYGENHNAGATYVVNGAVSGDFDLASATAKWTGEGEEDWSSFGLAGGQDWTGDGRPDVAIGAIYDDQTAHSAGAVYLVRPFQVSGTIDLGDAFCKILAEAAYDEAGYSVSPAGDVNGDGAQDLAIGSPFSSRNGNSSGMAHVVYGPIGFGELDLNTVTYRLVGEHVEDNAGCAVAGVGDLDGDGLDDVVVGACLSDRSGPDGGAAFQFSREIAVDTLVSDADGAMVSEHPGDHLGSAIAGGDLDNDGLADVIIGAPYHADVSAYDEQGAVYVAAGPATASMNVPDGKLLGEATLDHAGTSVAVPGDINGDGFDDLVVGAPGADANGEDAGAAYLVFGPIFGLVSLADADARITGAVDHDFLGQAVAPAGDVNADGWPDLLVGAPYHDGTSGGGATYLFTFGW